MPLPESGAISLDDIHVEAGGTTQTTASINDADIRGLIGKTAATTMSFSEWYGAANGPQIKYFGVATAGGTAGAYTFTVNTSVSTGDYILLIWICGYGSSTDTDWQMKVGTGSYNSTSVKAGFQQWFAANNYLKCYANQGYAQNSGSSITWLSGNWAAVSGRKAFALVVGNVTTETPLSVGTAAGASNMTVTSSPALAISFAASQADITPNPRISTASPSVENSSLSSYGGTSSSQYDLFVATHFATAGDITNGYFNIYRDWNIGEGAPSGDGIVLY